MSGTVRASFGLVVGATYPDELAAVRRIAPDIPLLVPGIGPREATLMLRSKPVWTRKGPVWSSIPAAQSFYASSGADWREAARRSAIATRDAINSAREL